MVVRRPEEVRGAKCEIERSSDSHCLVGRRLPPVRRGHGLEVASHGTVPLTPSMDMLGGGQVVTLVPIDPSVSHDKVLNGVDR